MIMPFGRYQGQDIKDVPSGCLHWLANNCDREDVREAADTEYRHRTEQDSHTELISMPFGKYEDQDIEDVPSSYLLWLAEECDREDVRRAADKEHIFREKHDTHFEE
jgi:uncharacterized protein (DUF3820 family)